MFCLLSAVSSPDARALTQVAVGDAHTCGISVEGHVYCWGEGRFGQLGDGAEQARARPVQVPHLSDVEELALGESHSCARTASGEVYCFGRNHRGQLGDGSARDQSLPVRVAWIKDAIGLAAGARHNCATLRSGRVACWGDNHYGQLATPSRLPFHRRPLALPDLHDVVQIQAGLAHTCFLTRDGNVRCAGGNYAGQLAADSPFPSAKALSIRGLPHVVEIGAGLVHTCARDVGGNIHCWGGNFPNGAQPALYTALSPASGLVVGGRLTCGTQEHILRCEGPDSAVATGSHSLEVHMPTIDMQGTQGGGQATITLSPSSLRAGSFHLCGLADGEAYCLGENSAGQLGDGTRGGLGSSMPLLVQNAKSNSTIRVRDGRFCVGLPDAENCWGPPGPSPLPPPFCRFDEDREVECHLQGEWSRVAEGAKVRQVAGGDRFGCWLDTQGNVFCIGQGLQGELGNGQLAVATTSPLWVPGLKQVTQLSAGRDFVCALEVIGQVKCWGSGLQGQLGTGMYRSSPQPVDVRISRDVEELSAGRSHICARRQNGEAWCWGEFYSGPEAIPRKLQLDARVIQLASHDATTCTRSADERIFCWGRGKRGELGQKNPLRRDTWHAVVGLETR